MFGKKLRTIFKTALRVWSSICWITCRGKQRTRNYSAKKSTFASSDFTLPYPLPMPVNKSAYARYRIIDDILNYKKIADLQFLREACERRLDTTFSERTIKKDIQDMRLDFDAPIVFDHYHKGYCYTHPFSMQTTMPLQSSDISALQFAVSTLSQFQEMPVFEDFKEAVDKIIKALKLKADNQHSNFIQFERVPFYKGSEWLSPIAQAIEARHPLRLQYRSFEMEEAQTRLHHPYLLKEYKHRWYVIGYDEQRESIRIFALDRIEALEPQTEHRYFRLEGFDADAYFKYALGITVLADQAPQDILLCFAPLQGKYIENQPLHPTQETRQTARGLEVKLRLVPSYELIAEILSYGESVKVLAPNSLRERIAEILDKATNLYRS